MNINKKRSKRIISGLITLLVSIAITTSTLSASGPNDNECRNGNSIKNSVTSNDKCITDLTSHLNTVSKNETNDAFSLKYTFEVTGISGGSGGLQ